MKLDEMTPRYEGLLRCFTHLPRQILSLHELDNATEFVLHSLCDEGCLNLQKAAYFVDNPDFNCLKGVAGFSREDEVYTCDTILSDPGHFNDHIDQCEYNQKIRTITVPSARRNGESNERLIARLADLLEMEKPAAHSWNIKHDNFGLLIYQHDGATDRNFHEEFLHGLSILGFCPVS
jgi:hypothetical protein